jgi:uncharacterized protein YukE
MAGAVLTDPSPLHTIVVDIADLRSRASRASQRAREAQNEVKGLDEAVEGLMGRWKGYNRDQFATYISFHVDYMAIHFYADYLDRYAQALSQVVKIYEGLQGEIDALVG